MLIAQLPGTISFSPFGSNTRAIVITVDPDRLRSHNFTPEDVVQALGTGNVVTPSGNLYLPAQMPLVPTNAMVADPQEMGNIPIHARQQRLHSRRGHDSRTPRTSTTAVPW